MQCTECRREIDENSKYCPFCGGKVEREIRQADERTESLGNPESSGNLDKNNHAPNEKSVGLISIMSYEWIINILVILSALVGGGLGAIVDMTSDGTGLWMVIFGVIGALVGFLCVLPMKIMAAIAHNVYISTDSVLTIKRQLAEMEKAGMYTAEICTEETYTEEETRR